MHIGFGELIGPGHVARTDLSRSLDTCPRYRFKPRILDLLVP